MMRRINRLLSLALSVGSAAGFVVQASATPYASNVTKAGVAVTFTLNEPADSLKYSINGGAPISIADTTKGAKTFNLSLPTDTFSIVAEKNATTGYSIPTGTQIQPTDLGSLSVATPAGGLNKISDDSQFYL